MRDRREGKGNLDGIDKIGEGKGIYQISKLTKLGGGKDGEDLGGF